MVQYREETQEDREAVKSVEQARLLADLIERVDALPHVARLGKGSWVQALHEVLSLVENPNNLDALWVWSAFCQAFGQGNTWQAERALNTLLNWEATREKILAVTGKPTKDATTEDLKFIQEAPSLKNCEEHCFILLEHVLSNFQKWRDLPEFVAHKRSLIPTEPAEKTEVQS